MNTPSWHIHIPSQHFSTHLWIFDNFLKKDSMFDRSPVWSGILHTLLFSDSSNKSIPPLSSPLHHLALMRMITCHFHHIFCFLPRPPFSPVMLSVCARGYTWCCRSLNASPPLLTHHILLVGCLSSRDGLTAASEDHLCRLIEGEFEHENVAKYIQNYWQKASFGLQMLKTVDSCVLLIKNQIIW